MLKRSKIFTKIIRELTVATRVGGEDADSNPRLRSAISLARASNMPLDNIKRAIAKGAGNDKDGSYEEIVYEGYGPHQVAAIVECLTDNKNRTVSSVRSIFNKNNGNLGSTNSVMYGFDHVGQIEVAKSAMGEDEITELIIEAGAEDIDTEDEEAYIITTEKSELHNVMGALEAKGIEIQKSTLVYVAQNKVEIDDVEKAKQVLKFIDALEDDDDVQTVHTNFDITESVIAELDG